MTRKTIAIVVLGSLGALACVTLAVTRAKPQSPRQQVSELEEKDNKFGLSLKERACLAKLKGQKKVTYTARSLSSSDYVSFSGIDASLAAYTVVIAQPIAQVTFISPAGEVATNYKFKIHDLISEPKGSQPPSGVFNGVIRPELLPVGKDEFILGAFGGTVMVDDVEVVSKFDNFEPFSPSKKYLLFLTFDSTKTLGGMEMGPLSAMAINEDGTLQTLDNDPRHDIKQALDSQFGNSAENVRAGLQRRAQSLKRAASK
jgi:hypothetical protein